MAQSQFEYTIVPFADHGFMWVTFSGPIDMGRLGRAYQQFLQHPDFEPGIDELLDFSAASLDKLGRADFEQLRMYMRDQTDRHDSRSVLVVSTRLEYGLVRMMDGMLAAEAPADRAQFYTLPEALEWLHPGKSDLLLAEYSRRLAEQN